MEMAPNLEIYLVAMGLYLISNPPIAASDRRTAMNTQPLDVLVTPPIRISVATRVAFATTAKERAKAKGLTAAQWSIERLKQPTTLAADLLMAFDVGGEVVSPARIPKASL